jgi:tetratricopeptide (TPR) repeat protein
MEKALELAINSEDNLRIAQAYAAMGFVSFHAGDGKGGKEMFEKYFIYSEGLKISRMERALMLASYGDCFELLGDYRSAIDIYLEAMAKFDPESIEERALLSQCSAYLGERYLMIGKPDSALIHFYNGMQYARKYTHLFGSMINSIELAEYYYENNSFDLCKTYCDSILYFGRRIESTGSFFGSSQYEHLLSASMEIFVPITLDYKKHLARTAMLKALQILQEIYKKEGNTDAAYASLQSSFELQDSIIRYEQKKELKEILTHYETDQKEKKILILSQENQLQEMKIRQNSLIIIGMAILVVFIVILATILFRQNKIKNEHQAILLKQRLFRSQMNPHFIFNAMGNIQSSIINEEPDKAIKYLSKFSKLMRKILEGSLEEKIPLSEEISLISNYLDLQKIRFAAKFDFLVDVDKKIDTEAVLIPPMLLQPFIENAIEHGINYKDSKGNINIRIKKVHEMILIEIEDDGIGRDKARELLLQKDKSHRSYATTLTQERIQTINKKLKKKITFNILDLTDSKGRASGTKVVFELPNSL